MSASGLVIFDSSCYGSTSCALQKKIMSRAAPYTYTYTHKNPNTYICIYIYIYIERERERERERGGESVWGTLERT
jgi:hypothetical protein